MRASHSGFNLTGGPTLTLGLSTVGTAPRFVNRSHETNAINALIAAAHDEGRPAIVVLRGSPGAGKSALARHWSRQWRSTQDCDLIQIDCAAYRREGVTVLTQLMSDVLIRLGHQADQIPAVLSSQVALYRRATKSGHVVLIIDDARNSADVRCLLPVEAPNVTLLITAQRSLADLVFDGASFIDVGPLRDGHDRLLLHSLRGAGSPGLNVETERQLLERCGGLPLALTICAAQLTSSFSSDPAMFLRTLETDSSSGGDSSTDTERLRSVLTAAYEALSIHERQAYRLLGLLPVCTWDAAAAAATLGVKSNVVHSLMRRLSDAQLLHRDMKDRTHFVVHPLIHEHAAHLCEQLDSASVRQECQARMVAHYRELAWELDFALHANRLRVSGNAKPGSNVAGTRALHEFDLARIALTKTQSVAIELGLLEDAAAIAEATWPLYHSRGHHEEAREVFERGALAARAMGDACLEARLVAQCARVDLELRRNESALDEIEHALTLARRGNNDRVMGSVLEWKGYIVMSCRPVEAAVGFLQESRAIGLNCGDQRAIAVCDYLLSRCYFYCEEYDKSLTHIEWALMRLVRNQDARLSARALLVLARIYGRRGEHNAGITCAVEAADLAAAIGDQAVEGDAREVEGGLRLGLGQALSAMVALHGAASCWETIRDTRLEGLRAQLASLAS